MPERLDEKYKSGIWYDYTCSEFTQIQESDTHDVQIVEPVNGNVCYEISIENWKNVESQWFAEVGSEAIESPEEIIERALDNHEPNSDANAVDLEYARVHTRLSAVGGRYDA